MPNEESEQQEGNSKAISIEPVQEATTRTREKRYFQLIVEALQTCTRYKPMFGKGQKGGIDVRRVSANV